MRCVVTGAGGYVGGRLVQHLRAAGTEVTPTVRTPVEWMPDAHEVDLVGGDLDQLVELFAGHDAVLHLAGANEAHVRDHPDRALSETVVATRRVAAATYVAEVPRLVHLSTFHVYGGRTDEGRVHERVVPEPRGEYAIARLAGEHLATTYGPYQTVSLRMTNAVGPPVDLGVDRWTLVANKLCIAAAQGSPLVIDDGGRGLRDFIDLAEACRVVGLAAAGNLPRGTYNLGTGTTTTILELANLIADVAEEVCGRRPEVKPRPAAGDPPPFFRVDVSNLAAYVIPPRSDIRDALAALITAIAER